MHEQTDILRALGTDLPGLEPVPVPEYQNASHGPSERLFAPVQTTPGQLALETDR